MTGRVAGTLKTKWSELRKAWMLVHAKWDVSGNNEQRAAQAEKPIQHFFRGAPQNNTVGRQELGKAILFLHLVIKGDPDKVRFASKQVCKRSNMESGGVLDDTDEDDESSSRRRSSVGARGLLHTGDKDELTELFSVESESERKVDAAIELRAHTERDNAVAARKRSMLQLLLDNKASLTSSQAGRLESALELALQEVCPDAPESPAAEDDDDATAGLLEFAAQGADDL